MMRAYLPLVNAIYVLLASSVCALVGCLPLTLAWFSGLSFDYYPLFCAAAALSAPGLAALFAIFRDHPALRPESFAFRQRETADGAVDGGDVESSSSASRGQETFVPQSESFGSRQREMAAQRSEGGSSRPTWIAAPYVEDDVMVAVFRPYLRAWRRVALRALSLSIPSAVLGFVFLYDIRLLVQVPWGAYAIPVCVVLSLLVVAALLVSLMLAVEFPKARWWSLIRNGVLLCVKRLPLAVVNLAVIAAYLFGLSRSPLLVGCLATGLACYLIYAGARWQMMPMAVAMARESHEPAAIALYDPDHTAADPAGRGGLTDFQQ